MSALASVIYKILAPWRYYTISDPTRTLIWINWWLPLFFASLTSFLLLHLQDTCPKTIEYLCRSKEVLALMAGFFITALSAVAVFDRKGMDDVMPGNVTAYFRSDIDKKMQHYPITRRRFLCMMFSFLAAQSFFLSFYMAVLPSFELHIYIWFILFYLASLYQIVFITLHGLYYLGEKLLNAQTND